MQILNPRVLIATSGYSYKDWKRVFYPEQLDSSEYLQYYSQHFPFTELNFSYYRQPSPDMIMKMIDKTREGFLFTIKAHQSLTHQVDGNWEEAAAQYKEAVTPLQQASRLGGILFQFPFSFHRNVENRRYLGQLTEYFSDLPLFLEFRNADWQLDEVYDSLKERNIGIVNTDNPALEGLPKKTAVTTSDAGYIRFHGRNSSNWWSGTNVSRYDYYYSEAELQEWIERIESMLQTVTMLYIAFNNHHKGQAVTNALQLQQMIQT